MNEIYLKVEYTNGEIEFFKTKRLQITSLKNAPLIVEVLNKSEYKQQINEIKSDKEIDFVIKKLRELPKEQIERILNEANINTTNKSS